MELWVDVFPSMIDLSYRIVNRFIQYGQHDAARFLQPRLGSPDTTCPQTYHRLSTSFRRLGEVRHNQHESAQTTRSGIHMKLGNRAAHGLSSKALPEPSASDAGHTFQGSRSSTWFDISKVQRGDIEIESHLSVTDDRERNPWSLNVSWSI